MVAVDRHCLPRKDKSMAVPTMAELPKYPKNRLKKRSGVSIIKGVSELKGSKLSQLPPWPIQITDSSQANSISRKAQSVMHDNTPTRLGLISTELSCLYAMRVKTSVMTTIITVTIARTIWPVIISGPTSTCNNQNQGRVAANSKAALRTLCFIFFTI